MLVEILLDDELMLELLELTDIELEELLTELVDELLLLELDIVELELDIVELLELVVTAGVNVIDT